MKYQEIQISQLQPFPIRDIREGVVEKISGLIEKDGFNPAKPLTVVSENGNYLVADGNHRLQVLKNRGIVSVPCLIREGDPYTLAVKGNRSEDTYAPMDLFDWLDVIKKMKEDGKSGKEIAEILGWSTSKVSDYKNVLKSISADFLVLLKPIQEGRADKKSAIADFTEGWFRDSGLYNISHESQLQFFEWFKGKNFKPGKAQQQKEIEQLREVELQLALLVEKLNTQIEDFENVFNRTERAILNREYTLKRLEKLINKLNEGAKNRALYGFDTLEVLRDMEDGSIDCVVTDPPWGVGFKSARDTAHPDYDPKLDEIEEYLRNVFAELARVTKDNSHLYVFYPTVHHCEFQEMLAEHFEVSPIPLIWVKGNHTPCDFESRYASKYETIFFCKKPNSRKLNNPVSPDVLEFGHDRERWHDSQKPISLIEYLIKNSTGTGETVLDCFAGSGVSLLAAKKSGRYFVGIDKETQYEGRFKRELAELG